MTAQEARLTRHDLPPHDVGAEEAVLAALLLDEAAFDRVQAIVNIGDFFDDATRATFAAATALHGRGETIDVVTVAHELDHVGRLDEVGGESYLLELSSRYFTAIGVEAHARIVAEAATYRRLIQVGADLVASAHRGGADPDAVIADVEAQLAQLRGRSLTHDQSMSALLDWSAFFEADHRTEDWLIEPVAPRGRAIALWAPAKSMKTLFTQYVAVHAAMGGRVLDQVFSEPIDVLYVDEENTAADLFERLEAMGFDATADLSHLHYALLPSLPPLDTAAGGAALMALVKECNAQLVILDAFSRVINGPENESDTLRAYYRHTGQHLKAAGITAIRLDNSGKDPSLGARGSSGKVDDVDVVWQLMPRGNGLRLHATHRRQAWVPEYVDVIREADPLRFMLADRTWPAGTRELATTLDDLGIPLAQGRVEVRKTLKRNEIKATNDVLSAAIRYRREAPEPVRDAFGQVSFDEHGQAPGQGVQEVHGQPADRFGQDLAAHTDSSVSLDTDSPVPGGNGAAWRAGEMKCVECGASTGTAERCPHCASARVTRKTVQR